MLGASERTVKQRISEYESFVRQRYSNISDEILDGHLTMKEVCRIYGLYSKVNNTKGARIRNATARNDAIKASLCSCMDTDIICHTSWNLELSSGCK